MLWEFFFAHLFCKFLCNYNDIWFWWSETVVFVVLVGRLPIVFGKTSQIVSTKWFEKSVYLWCVCIYGSLEYILMPFLVTTTNLLLYLLNLTGKQRQKENMNYWSTIFYWRNCLYMSIIIRWCRNTTKESGKYISTNILLKFYIIFCLFAFAY